MLKQPDFQVEAQLTKLSTMADGSVRLEFTTQEVRPEDFAKFYELRNLVGSIAFLVHKPSIVNNPSFGKPIM